MRVVPCACALAAALTASALTASAEVRVRLVGDRVDLEATNAPLSEILNVLAEKTGMKVVYDGPPPRTLLTTTLASRSHPEAVLALFEGLGLNFALSLDRTGSRVDTLLVVGASGAGSRAAPIPSRGPAPVARPTPPPEDPATEGEPEEPPPIEPNAPEPGPEAARPGPPEAPGARPFNSGARPGSPFDLRPAPLTLPTPVPPSPQPAPGQAAEPAPEPTPTPPIR